MENKGMGGIEALLQGNGASLSISPDDTATVADFIMSHDALRRLDEEFDLKQLFGSPMVDRLHCFAGITLNDSFEGLYLYFCAIEAGLIVVVIGRAGVQELIR
jgi:capsule polysaccharide export protein KpsE/RkpR